MALQEQLNALREKFHAMAPKKSLDIIHRATEDLKDSGVLEKALNVGDRLPDFSLNNSKGQPVRVWNFLAGGPLVLTFYRGKW
jgi:hypothetical protein